MKLQFSETVIKQRQRMWIGNILVTHHLQKKIIFPYSTHSWIQLVTPCSAISSTLFDSVTHQSPTTSQMSNKNSSVISEINCFTQERLLMAEVSLKYESEEEKHEAFFYSDRVPLQYFLNIQRTSMVVQRRGRRRSSRFLCLKDSVSCNNKTNFIGAAEQLLMPFNVVFLET